MMIETHPELLGKVVERLKALADENRIRLLLRLRNGDCNVMTLTAQLGLSQASVSKHLIILKRVGLVTVARKGTQAIYSVTDKSIFDLCSSICDGVVRHLRIEHEALGLAPGKTRALRPMHPLTKGKKI